MEHYNLGPLLFLYLKYLGYDIRSIVNKNGFPSSVDSVFSIPALLFAHLFRILFCRLVPYFNHYSHALMADTVVVNAFSNLHLLILFILFIGAFNYLNWL
jgi:hypothetical protein